MSTAFTGAISAGFFSARISLSRVISLSWSGIESVGQVNSFSLPLGTSPSFLDDNIVEEREVEVASSFNSLFAVSRCSKVVRWFINSATSEQKFRSDGFTVVLGTGSNRTFLAFTSPPMTSSAISEYSALVLLIPFLGDDQMTFSSVIAVDLRVSCKKESSIPLSKLAPKFTSCLINLQVLHAVDWYSGELLRLISTSYPVENSCKFQGWNWILQSQSYWILWNKQVS